VRAKNKELNDLQLIWDEDHGVRQVLGCDKDSFFIYDDDKEKTDLLRIVKGGNKSEIAVI
jgi:hypothetical protein